MITSLKTVSVWWVFSNMILHPNGANYFRLWLEEKLAKIVTVPRKKEVCVAMVYLLRFCLSAVDMFKKIIAQFPQNLYIQISSGFEIILIRRDAIKNSSPFEPKIIQRPLIFLHNRLHDNNCGKKLPYHFIVFFFFFTLTSTHKKLIWNTCK